MPWTSPWVRSRRVPGRWPPFAAVLGDGLRPSVAACARAASFAVMSSSVVVRSGGRHEHRGEDHGEHENQAPRDASAPRAHGAQAGPAHESAEPPKPCRRTGVSMKR